MDGNDVEFLYEFDNDLEVMKYLICGKIFSM